MRDRANETESTVSRDGITVYQTFEKERFSSPSVMLDFVSDRNDATTLQVVVDLPADLHTKRVGFHPNYRGGDWTVTSDRLEFSTEIDTEEEVTTIYTVDSLTEDQVRALFDNLTIARVAGTSEAEAVETADSGFDPLPDRQSERVTSSTSAENITAENPESQAETESVRDNPEQATADAVEFSQTKEEATVSDGSHRGKSVNEPGHAASDNEDQGPPGAFDGSGADTGNGDEADNQKPGDSERQRETPERPSLADCSTATLVAELDQRIQSGEVTDKDRASLSQLRLDEPDGAVFSDELGVAQLQQQVSNLEAGMEEIAEFEQRHGHPTEAFTDLREELAALDDRVEEVSPRVDDISDEVDSLAETQATLKSDVSVLREWHDRIKSSLRALGDR